MADRFFRIFNDSEDRNPCKRSADSGFPQRLDSQLNSKQVWKHGDGRIRRRPQTGSVCVHAGNERRPCSHVSSGSEPRSEARRQG